MSPATVVPTFAPTPAAPVAVPNPAHTGWRCLRCQALFARLDFERGCPHCAQQQHASNLTAVYTAQPVVADAAAPGIYRWGAALPYLAGLSLGEGQTPCVPVPRLAQQLGLASVSLKLESANPTGSHKDRMSALTITRALELGAPSVALASSGNAGVSAACYAAAAGLVCDVAVLQSLGAASARLLHAAGARVHRFATSIERWHFVERQVREHGAYALTNFVEPAVGSPPVGVEAYRTLAFELHAQSPVLPQHLVVPTARGDLLAGLASGFLTLLQQGQITQLPRLWAVEPFARLSAVLAGSDYRSSFVGSTAQTSTAGHTATWQAVHALRATHGGAVVVTDSQAWQGWYELGRQGWPAELCTAAAWAALRLLRERGDVAAGAHAVVLFTSRSDRDTAEPPGA
jgi:threonine synthase